MTIQRLKGEILRMIGESPFSLEDVLAEIKYEEDDIEKILMYAVAKEFASQKMKDPQTHFLVEKYERLLDEMKQKYA